jgi:hypothetical protein
MNILLPLPSFTHSVAVLDRERLGKQRFDCRQVLAALRAERKGGSMTFGGEPVVTLWRGYESALALYYTFCVNEWVSRGYNNTMVTPYDLATWQRRPGEDAFLTENVAQIKLPHWLGDGKLHESHRAWLLSSAPDHYRQLDWVEVAQDLHWPENQLTI